MEYRTVQEIAEKWNLSVRMVQQLCSQGRIPGARKFGKSWAVPADAVKPADPRRNRERAPTPPQPELFAATASFMPLMNTPFPLGGCLAAVEAMEDTPLKNIALAEYHYFSGQPDLAAREAEPWLTGEDLGVRLSA